MKPEEIESLLSIPGESSTADPTHRFANGCHTTLRVTTEREEPNLLIHASEIADEDRNPHFVSSLISVPFPLLREALGRAGYGMFEMPKDGEEPREMAELLTRFARFLLKDIKSLNERLTKAVNIGLAEHKRADENFLDLRNEIGTNRLDVREGIIRYLVHLSNPEAPTALSATAKEIVAQVAEWIQENHDQEWLNKQGDSGPKEH